MLTLYAQLHYQESELRIKIRMLKNQGVDRVAIVKLLIQEIYADNNVVLGHVDECDLNDDDIMRPLRAAQKDMFNTLCECI